MLPALGAGTVEVFSQQKQEIILITDTSTSIIVSTQPQALASQPQALAEYSLAAIFPGKPEFIYA